MSSPDYDNKALEFLVLTLLAAFFFWIFVKIIFL